MRRRFFLPFVSLFLLVCLLFAGCGDRAADVSSLVASPTDGTSAPAATEPATAAFTVSDAGDSAVVIDEVFTVTTDDGAYTADGTVYTLTAAGTYTLAGELTDGRIIVAAGEDDEITLCLAGVSLCCTTDSPVKCLVADKVKIKAVADTYNEITDARPLRTDENDTTGSAAIYAECDLTLTGAGSLVVAAAYHNGVHTKDDLTIKNLTLKVTAPNNALKGNDSLTIESGEIIAVSTSGDALKTSNSDVSAKGNRRGTVTVSGGRILLYAGCDGIDAAYDVEITGEPQIAVYTHRYSPYTDSSLLTTQSGTSSAPSGGRPGQWGGGMNEGNKNKSTESAKGIKAADRITVSGGEIVISCMDDGLHADSDEALENGETPLGDITITGGSITVTAADDGLHADGTLEISGGTVTVLSAYEGMEGHYVCFKGGVTRIYATDDGVNATSAGTGSNGLITVSGGEVYVEVSGGDVDGIDANGSYTQTGGCVVVSNPNADSSGNMAAVDADGTVSVTGGILVALGAIPSSGGGGRRPGMGAATSIVPSGAVTFSVTLAAGTHTFTYGGTTLTFTLKNRVSSGWAWASGITSSNYSLV